QNCFLTQHREILPFAAAARACSSTSRFPQGKWIHACPSPPRGGQAESSPPHQAPAAREPDLCIHHLVQDQCRRMAVGQTCPCPTGNRQEVRSCNFAVGQQDCIHI